MMNKKKLIKKIKKMIKEFTLLLFTSGIIVVLIELWHSDEITKPKTWMKIDSLEPITYSSFSYPSEIYIDYNKSFSNIFENSFVIDLHIKNGSENEVVLSELKFNMSQYKCDFPILLSKGYIENGNFVIDITNLSNQNLENLDISLHDEEMILYEVYGRNLNTNLEELKKDETVSITFFDLKDIIGKKVDSWVLTPYVTISDLCGNMLSINLGWFSLNKKEYENYIEEQQFISDCIRDKYLYNITPDIIINNEEVYLDEIVEYIPAHETLNLKILITSQVACAFDLQLLYKLDDEIYKEEKMDFIIYNPDNSRREYEYFDEYIEIK